MTRLPTDAEIQRVMDETGMQYIQARNHLVQKYAIQDRLVRERNPYPLGKTTSLEV